MFSKIEKEEECFNRTALRATQPETIGALNDNIREAIDEIQLHTIDNVLKNLTDRVGQPRPPFE